MIYFISDIHLGFRSREEDLRTEEKLLTFLKKIEEDAEALVIVGDLFDFWFDYRTVIPYQYFRILTALKHLREKGIIIEYVIGNHDFGHFRFFRNELGIEPIKEDIERTYYGKKFYISHGDGKSNKDNGYKILKKILRSPLNQKLFRMLHPDIGIWLASGSSRKSRHYTETKDYGNSDGMQDFAFRKIDDGADYVIMGHRHILTKAEYRNGYYINLGDWIKNPHIGKFDGKSFELEKIDDFLNK